jgi:cytochrome c oxidase subunit 2
MLRKFSSPRSASAALVAGLLGALIAPAAHAAWALNMPQGVTAMSQKIYALHMTIFWWCVWIGVAVFGVMIYSLVKFRRSVGAVPDTTLVHSTRVEIIWTVIPVIILVIMAVPAARTLIELEDATDTELTVKITAYQWKWQYDYLDQGVSYFSTLSRDSDAARQLQSGADVFSVQNYLLSVDRPFVVPVGTKVRLLITAQDVIHAWWVPALAVKKDAIPGFVNEAWFDIQADKPGLYRGQCAELCGRDHGFMPIVVEAKSKEDFAAWIKTQAAEQKQASATAANKAG